MLLPSMIQDAGETPEWHHLRKRQILRQALGHHLPLPVDQSFGLSSKTYGGHTRCCHTRSCGQQRPRRGDPFLQSRYPLALLVLQRYRSPLPIPAAVFKWTYDMTRREILLDIAFARLKESRVSVYAALTYCRSADPLA